MSEITRHEELSTTEKWKGADEIYEESQYFFFFFWWERHTLEKAV